MAKGFGPSDPRLEEYVINLFSPEDPVLEEVRHRIKSSGQKEMQVSPMDGLHLEVIARTLGAEKAIEIGTFAGYSGICIARGLKETGYLYTLEINEERATMAMESFRKAGLEKKTEVVIGPAVETLMKLQPMGPFDLVFIDADKANYSNYLRWATENVRIGGVVLGDNTLAWGNIHDLNTDQNTIKALQKFNEDLTQNKHFRSTILPTGAGLTYSVKVK